MAGDLGIGLGAAALIVGFPVLLLGFLWFMGWLESWMLAPDERAAAVSRLLEQVDEAEELERAVALLMAEVADRPGGRTSRADATGRTPLSRRRAVRLAGLRRAARR